MSKKVILYGNADCPDCVVLKELFDREGIRYGYVDVLGGLGHFKKFLLLRDKHREAFEEIIANEKIGIPALVVDDEAVFAEVKAEGLDLSLFR